VIATRLALSEGANLEEVNLAAAWDGKVLVVPWYVLLVKNEKYVQNKAPFSWLSNSEFSQLSKKGFRQFSAKLETALQQAEQAGHSLRRSLENQNHADRTTTWETSPVDVYRSTRAILSPLIKSGACDHPLFWISFWNGFSIWNRLILGSAQFDISLISNPESFWTSVAIDLASLLIQGLWSESLYQTAFNHLVLESKLGAQPDARKWFEQGIFDREYQKELISVLKSWGLNHAA